MAITDSQKVDYLFKKLGYSVAKTDTSTVKSPSNESIASPLVVRNTAIWGDSPSIPAVIPSSNSSVVLVYNDTIGSSVQTTSDITATANRTWLTNLTNWIDPSYGSTYQVKVYLATTGNALPQTYGVQLFADGTGSDEWFFDYQSGVLNFIGTSLPSQTFTGKSIFISGARYVGTLGITTGNITFSGNTISVSGTNANLNLSANGSGYISGGTSVFGNILLLNGNISTTNTNGNLTLLTNGTGNIVLSNLSIANNTISNYQGNIVLTPNSTGIVQVTGTTAISLPAGSTAQQPSGVAAGSIRFNTELGLVEVWNGVTWDPIGLGNVAIAQTINPDGITNVYSLISNATTAGTFVTINGTVQKPDTAYAISGNQITFTEIPNNTDIVDIRIFADSTTIAALSSTAGNNLVQLTSTSINFTTNNVLVKQINSSGATVGTIPNTAIATSGVATTIDSYPMTTYRTAKYIVQATVSSSLSESYEVIVTHDGSTTAYRTVYAVINSGSSLGTISATVSSGNVLVQYTATNNNTNIRISKDYLLV